MVLRRRRASRSLCRRFESVTNSKKLHRKVRGSRTLLFEIGPPGQDRRSGGPIGCPRHFAPVSRAVPIAPLWSCWLGFFRSPACAERSPARQAQRPVGAENPSDEVRREVGTRGLVRRESPFFAGVPGPDRGPNPAGPEGLVELADPESDADDVQCSD